VTSTHRGILAALAAFGIFATHDVIIKFLGASYSPFQIVFFSVLFGFPMVTFLLMRDPQPGQPAPGPSVVDGAAHGRCRDLGRGGFYAFSALPLAQVYAILFAAPLLITVLAIPILGERVGIRGHWPSRRPWRRDRRSAAHHDELTRRPLRGDRRGGRRRLPPSSCARSGGRNARSC
jgi:hypothetical protein